MFGVNNFTQKLQLFSICGSIDLWVLLFLCKTHWGGIHMTSELRGKGRLHAFGPDKGGGGPKCRNKCKQTSYVHSPYGIINSSLCAWRTNPLDSRSSLFPPLAICRHRGDALHLVRGAALAQRLLPLLLLQDLHGRKGLHHRQRGHPLPGVRQEEAHGRRRRAVGRQG